MSQIGSTEALEKYLQLEKENERLRKEIGEWKYRYEEYRTAWSKESEAINTVWNWLGTREDTKTRTIKKKIAELFKYAYMEAEFEEFRSKWKNREAIELARINHPTPALESTSHEAEVKQ